MLGDATAETALRAADVGVSWLGCWSLRPHAITMVNTAAAVGTPVKSFNAGRRSVGAPLLRAWTVLARGPLAVTPLSSSTQTLLRRSGLVALRSATVQFTYSCPTGFSGTYMRLSGITRL